MTVGVVVVSHSAALANGVRELAGQMAPDVTIAAAGGTEDGELGTSFDLVVAALADADSGAGAVVLYDLGSALLATETALEFAEPDAAERIVVVDAPLVEGAVAAAVAAQSGADLADVADAARRAGSNWVGASKSEGQPAGDRITESATVADAAGIHARPAALLGRALADTPEVQVSIGRPNQDGVDARDVLGLIGLGLRQGEAVEISGTGPGAPEAIRTLSEMISAGMD